MTTPEIIDQIHELILEERRIWAKSITEQLGISLERVDSTIHKDLDVRKFSAKWVLKCWTRIKNVIGASLSKFWNFFRRDPKISCCDWWLWTKPGYITMWWLWTKPGYITMTRRQSNNQLSSGIAVHPPHPKKKKFPNAKIHWKSSRLEFLGSRRHPPHWLSSKEPNYQRGVLIIFAGAIEVHFEGKTPRGDHQGGLVLARQCPGSPSTCN